MTVSTKGYGEKVLTFNTTLTSVGVPVLISGGSLVQKAAAEKDFLGFTCYADGEIAGVIIDGYIEVPYTGTIPSFGFTNLVSNGTTGVKVPGSSTTSNHTVRVLKVDTENKIVGFIL